jgi:hypothetical protein
MAMLTTLDAAAAAAVRSVSKINCFPSGWRPTR